MEIKNIIAERFSGSTLITNFNNGLLSVKYEGKYNELLENVATQREYEDLIIFIKLKPTVISRGYVHLFHENGYICKIKDPLEFSNIEIGITVEYSSYSAFVKLFTWQDYLIDRHNNGYILNVNLI